MDCFFPEETAVEFCVGVAYFFVGFEPGQYFFEAVVGIAATDDRGREGIVFSFSPVVDRRGGFFAGQHGDFAGRDGEVGDEQFSPEG